MVVTSPKEAILSHTPAIGALIKTINNGELFIKAVVVNIISELVLFLNVGKNMNQQQIGVTADMIMKRFNYFKIEDFKLVFDRIKIGHYGKLYDRMDGQFIFECLGQYDQERLVEAEQISFDSHTNKKLESPNLIAPEVVEMYKEVLKLKEKRSPMVATDVKLTEPGAKHRYEATWKNEAELEKELKEKREEERKKTVIEKSPRDRYIQSCFFEFDKIHSNLPAKDEKGEKLPGRFIEYEGKIVDQVEYTQIKLKEYDTLISKGEDLKL